MLRGNVRRASVPRGDRPHAFRVRQCSRADSLLDPQRLDVVIMKEIIKAFAMDPVFIVPKILRIGPRIGLIEITSSFGTDANTRPDIADYILNVRLFDQYNGSAGILYNRGLITFGIPIG